MAHAFQLLPRNANDNGPGEGSSKSTAGNGSDPNISETGKDNSKSIGGDETNPKRANDNDVIDGNGHIADANSVSANHGVTKPRVCIGDFKFKGKQIGKIVFFWKLIRDFTPNVDIYRLNGLNSGILRACSNGQKKRKLLKKRKDAMVDCESSSDTDSGIHRGKIDLNSKQDGNKL